MKEIKKALQGGQGNTNNTHMDYTKSNNHNQTKKQEADTKMEIVKEDLKNSYLTIEDVKAVAWKLIETKDELRNVLGFTSINNKDILQSTQAVLKIPYPGTNFSRVKLYPKIDDIKYLQPKNIAPQPYILPSIAKLKNKSHKPVIFTEGEKKTLCLIKNGYYAIGLAGVWEFKNKKQGEPFLKELEGWNWKERTVHICFDADALFNSQVLKAEIELALNLYFRGAKVFIIRLPQPNHTEKVGVDDFIAQKGIEAFKQLYNEALPFTKAYKKEYMDEVFNRLAQLLTQLKDVDKFQFEKLKMELQKVWGISEKKFSYLLALKTESLQQKQEEPEYTQEEEKQAEELLKQPDILDRMVKLTEATGHIGEEINKKVLYLSAISIKTDKAISVFVKGTSSAGKNSLVDTIRALLPNKACKKLSDISSKALYHVKDNDISHKILYITETDGGQQSDYPLRLISSENELTYTYPIKNPQTGEFTTIEKHIKAEGTAIWQTTTSLKLTVDNENRAIDLYIDESEAQTRRILLQQAKKIDGNFEPKKGFGDVHFRS